MSQWRYYLAQCDYLILEIFLCVEDFKRQGHFKFQALISCNSVIIYRALITEQWKVEYTWLTNLYRILSFN